jgi:hypothetical protein
MNIAIDIATGVVIARLHALLLLLALLLLTHITTPGY